MLKIPPTRPLQSPVIVSNTIPVSQHLAALFLLGVALSSCGGEDADNTSAAQVLPDSGLKFIGDMGAADTEEDLGSASVTCPGGPFCTCSDNDECDSGMCIWTPDGKQCTQTCVDACPDNFKCAQVPQGSDIINVCIPRWGHVCEPCSTETDCAMPGLDKVFCIDHGGQGAFCGAPCTVDDNCPSGYTCGDAVTTEGANVKQCVRLQGDACPCSKYAIANQLSTDCYTTGPNASKCHGVVRCEDKGLSECTVPPNTKEICDGLDNDCDGSTDNLACDDNNPCTMDICDPSRGTNACTHKNVEQPCNADDNLCTDNDMCHEGVCVPGKAKVCDNNNPCTLDSCKPATGCVHTPDNSKPCDDENPCTLGDACKEGVCTAGQSKICKSTDPCVAAKCDLTNGGKCAYSKKPELAPCDDEDPCTAETKCTSGNCIGKPANCDDGNTCTSDTCDQQSGCKHAPLTDGAPCEDGTGCTKGGGCKSGTCMPGTPIKCDDQDPCTSDKCDIKTGKCVYAPIPGCGGNCTTPAHCKDDGNPCTDKACVQLKCVYPPNTAACDDGDPCTDSDVCSGGVCKGQGVGCDDKNPCTSDGCDPLTKACKHTPNTAPCNDGNVCTSGDVCSGGQCKAGAPSCNKGDKCQTNGDCITGACVNGVCVSALKCGPLKTVSDGKLGDVVIDKAATFNTNSGTLSWGGKTIGGNNAPGVQIISQSGGAPQIRVLHFKSLQINQGVTLKVTGTLGAALIAQGTINVAGTIVAKGSKGNDGQTNSAGSGGYGVAGGFKGGHFISGQGCIANAGKGFGPGGGSAAACGGGGSSGGTGNNGGGGGGGGGGCGGIGGTGAGHASVGVGGMSGDAATNGTKGLGFSGQPGSAGSGCSGTMGGGAGQSYGPSTQSTLLGGSGGSGGGYGGFAGFGGKAYNSCNSTTFGGAPGFSGGGGGGGGGGGILLMCATAKITVASTGVLNVSGGDGGMGGTSGIAEGGKNPSYNVKCAAGGGGGGGRSGGGGGGGGGSGGALFLTAGSILHNGQLLAGGGNGGGTGWAFSGGFNGFGKNGGGNGGKGGSGGKGGAGGKGGLGWIRIEAGSAVMNGTYKGKVTQGSI